MTRNADPTPLISRLQIPASDLGSLSFCRGNRSTSVRDWVERLPVTQINRTGSQLYRAVPEVARLQVGAAQRLELLEILRPSVQQNLEGLTRNFVEQPLLHSEAAMKTAIVAQALQRHMSLGYCAVIRDLCASRPRANFRSAEREQLALALHRAISGLGLQLLRSAQIYTQPSSQTWTQLTSLYRLAEGFDLCRTSCPDPLLQKRSANTIEQAFCRVLMFACAYPNQLTPKEAGLVYELSESWVQLVQLRTPTPSPRDLFVLDLDGELGPDYKSNLDGRLTAQHRELMLSTLLDAIQKQRDRGDSGDIIDIPAHLPEPLLRHLLQRWSQQLQRQHTRNRNLSQLRVAIGLTNIHFHLAGQRPFREFLQGSDNSLDSLFNRDDALDPWNSAFDSEHLGHGDPGAAIDMPGNRDATPTDAPAHPTYQVQMLDFSAEGLRIDWRDDIPPQVKSGEILAILDSGRQPPRIGVIRWARQHKHGTQLGIQLIALRAEPAAIQQLHKTGDDNVFMRALLAARGRGGDLDLVITAAHPFRERHKVRILDRDRSFTALLTQQDIGTASASRFQFREQDTLGKTASEAASSGDEDFSSEW